MDRWCVRFSTQPVSACGTPRGTSDHPTTPWLPALSPEPILLLHLTYHRSLLLHAWSAQAPGVPEQLVADLLPPCRCCFSLWHGQSTKGQTVCEHHCHSPPAAGQHPEQQMQKVL